MPRTVRLVSTVLQSIWQNYWICALCARFGIGSQIVGGINCIACLALGINEGFSLYQSCPSILLGRVLDRYCSVPSAGGREKCKIISGGLWSLQFTNAHDHVATASRSLKQTHQLGKRVVIALKGLSAVDNNCAWLHCSLLFCTSANGARWQICHC